jgi:hypothetical protein
LEAVVGGDTVVVGPTEDDGASVEVDAGALAAAVDVAVVVATRELDVAGAVECPLEQEAAATIAAPAAARMRRARRAGTTSHARGNVFRRAVIDVGMSSGRHRRGA